MKGWDVTHEMLKRKHGSGGDVSKSPLRVKTTTKQAILAFEGEILSTTSLVLNAAHKQAFAQKVPKAPKFSRYA